MSATQANTPSVLQDMDWATNLMPTKGVANAEKRLLLRTAISQLDWATQMVISYAVTMRKTSEYIIRDVQSNRHFMQTATDAAEQLQKRMQERNEAIEHLKLLVQLIWEMPNDITQQVAADIVTVRNQIIDRICFNAAERQNEVA